MSNEKADRFLDTWRRLETVAERIVGPDDRGGSTVVRLCRDPRFSGYRDRLDYCREVRNLLSHEAKVNGEYAVIPSDAMQQMLEEILEKLEYPPRVTEVMTPADQLITVTPASCALATMRRMNQLGVSHAPLLENNRVTGVFSIETIFQAVMDGICRIEEDTPVSIFAHYLPLDCHMGQDFRFVDQGTTLTAAKSIFDKAYDRNHKLKLLLVTRGGGAQEPLLGVLSPYDLLGEPSPSRPAGAARAAHSPAQPSRRRR